MQRLTTNHSQKCPLSGRKGVRIEHMNIYLFVTDAAKRDRHSQGEPEPVLGCQIRCKYNQVDVAAAGRVVDTRPENLDSIVEIVHRMCERPPLEIAEPHVIASGSRPHSGGPP